MLRLPDQLPSHVVGQLCRRWVGGGRCSGRRIQLPLPLPHASVIVPQARHNALEQNKLVLLICSLDLLAPPPAGSPVWHRSQAAGNHLTPPHPSPNSPPPRIVVVIILWSFPFCGQLQLGFNLYFFVVVRSYFIVRPHPAQQ